MIIVTGGAGYIGSVVIQHVERLCKTPTWCLDNLTYEDDYNRFAFVNIDITDRKALHSWLDKCPTLSCIIHLAAIVGDGACNVNPSRTMDVNVEGTRNIVDWVKKNRNVRLVYASTCSVYGEADKLLNESSVANPISLYAESKLIGEGIVKEVDDHLIFRLGTIFGLSTYPYFGRIRSDLVINAMSFRAAEGNPITVIGENQWRPFVHVMDVGRIIAAGAISSHRGTFILAHQNWKLGEVAKAIAEQIPGSQIATLDGAPQDMRNYKVDTSKIKSIGLEPSLSIQFGIDQIYKAMKTKRIKNPWISKYNNAKFMQELNNGKR